MEPIKGRPSEGKVLRGTGVFLTYSQCHIAESGDLWLKLEEALVRAGLPFSKYCVAQETHKDGNLHYHVIVKFSSRVRFSPHTFDIPPSHPNVQTLKSESSSLVYLSKECPYAKMVTNYEEEDFVPTARKRRKLENREILEEFKDGGLKGLVDKGFIPLLKIKEAKEAMEIYSSLSHVDKRESLPACIPNPFNQLMNATGKRRHYWIAGKSNTGKTTFALDLIRKYRGSFLNVQQKWQVGLKETDEFYVVDEFSGQLTMQQINAICDGTYVFDVKYGAPIPTTKDSRLFILSNFKIDDIYRDTATKETITNRFNPIYL